MIRMPVRSGGQLAELLPKCLARSSRPAISSVLVVSCTMQSCQLLKRAVSRPASCPSRSCLSTKRSTGRLYTALLQDSDAAQVSGPRQHWGRPPREHVAIPSEVLLDLFLCFTSMIIPISLSPHFATRTIAPPFESAMRSFCVGEILTSRQIRTEIDDLNSLVTLSQHRSLFVFPISFKFFYRRTELLGEKVIGIYKPNYSWE